jgi:negative regulator of genetic competence, sporulation and motility
MSEWITKKQERLVEEEINDEWFEMPEFEQNQHDEYLKIIVRFEDKNAVIEFSKLIKQNITDKTKSIWYPQKIKDGIWRWIDAS